MAIYFRLILFNTILSIEGRDLCAQSYPVIMILSQNKFTPSVLTTILSFLDTYILLWCLNENAYKRPQFI